MPDSVKVSLASVRRAWVEGGYDESWLQLRTKDVSEDTIGQVANEANEGEEEPVGAFCQLSTRTPRREGLRRRGVRQPGLPDTLQRHPPLAGEVLRHHLLTRSKGSGRPSSPSTAVL